MYLKGDKSPFFVWRSGRRQDIPDEISNIPGKTEPLTDKAIIPSGSHINGHIESKHLVERIQNVKKGDKTCMRKIMGVAFTLVLAFILVSCSFGLYAPMDNIKIGLKNDTSGGLGMAAVVYGDRIYYTSNELGKEGICSMKPDGSDVKQEIENPSIKMLQLLDGKLYFSGLSRIDDGTTANPTRIHHSIYFNEIGSSQCRKYGSSEDIAGFYITKDGLSFLYSDSIILHRDTINSYKQKIIKSISFSYHEDNIEKLVYQAGEHALVFGYMDGFPTELDYSLGRMSYVLSTDTKTKVLSEYTNEDQADAFKAFCMDDENIYCSFNEMVVVLNRSDYSVKATFIPGGLTNEYTIENISRFGGDLYILADRWTDTGERTPPLLNEKLFHMDAKTLEWSEVLSLGRNQRILGVNKENVPLLDNGVIYKVALKGKSIGEKSKLIDAPGDISSHNYMVDYAGDWMFLYKIYPETDSPIYGDSPGQQLMYKINLKSGEAIQNDAKLDFSALKAYEN